MAGCPTPPALVACEACHWFEPGRPARAKGPSLAGIAGQPALHDGQFEYYSLALKAAQAKGLIWTDENLIAYLSGPKIFLNEFNGQELRNSMMFQMKDQAERKAAVEGLKAISTCQ